MSQKSNDIEKAIKQERGRLFNYIRKNVRVKEDAEDILQDVFYQFLTGFGEIEFLDKISGWMMKVARNKIIDFQRRKAAGINESDRTISSKDENPGDYVMLSDILPDLSLKPDDLLLRALIQEEIDLALEEMPDEQREVFIMNEFEDMSFREISKVLNVPVNTLLSRKRYAVLYLRKRLKNLYEV
ncbi:MAG: RNA polymerase sigma factor [Syntrophothermus sp.]